MFSILLLYKKVIAISKSIQCIVNYGKLLLKWHRCAHLLKQQSSITVHRLPTKENKQQTNGSVQFPFSVCVKQTEVAIFLLVPFFDCVA
jgi:hypothetical protein